MRSKSLFWGLVLILLGALFLLQNSGLLAIDVWELFWPLLLIVLGLSVLLRRASSSTSEMETLDVPLRDATKARIKLRHGAGRLRLGTGASATRLIMPAGAGYTEADIRSGAAAVTVEIPPDVAASIRTRGALATVDVDQRRFPRQGEMYRSPGYEAAQNKIEIDVETGVGTITIR